MEKLFSSKVAFIVFVTIFTTFLLIVYKNPTARTIICLVSGTYFGWNIGQWYWTNKFKELKKKVDEHNDRSGQNDNANINSK